MTRARQRSSPHEVRAISLHINNFSHLRVYYVWVYNTKSFPFHLFFLNCSGTRFKLLSGTASVALNVSEDMTSVQYPVETYNKMSAIVE